MTLAIPTVHLNGTSKEALLDQVYEAVEALHAAGRKLAAAAPNARDYYVQPNEAQPFTRAQTEHYARMTKLKEVIAELEQIGEGIVDQS